jgi:hypothetical protein
MSIKAHVVTVDGPRGTKHLVAEDGEHFTIHYLGDGGVAIKRCRSVVRQGMLVSRTEDVVVEAWVFATGEWVWIQAEVS